MDDYQLLFAEAKLGLDADVFLASDVGRYLLGRAEQEIEAAYLDLERVRAEDADTIRTLQNQIWRAKSIRQWLHEAIEAGNLAEQQLRDNEH